MLAVKDEYVGKHRLRTRLIRFVEQWTIRKAQKALKALQHDLERRQSRRTQYA